MSTNANAPAESRTLVENVRWETYVALAEDRPGSVPRMVYDCGAMELMSPVRLAESIVEQRTERSEIELLRDFRSQL